MSKRRIQLPLRRNREASTSQRRRTTCWIVTGSTMKSTVRKMFKSSSRRTSTVSKGQTNGTSMRVNTMNPAPSQWTSRNQTTTRYSNRSTRAETATPGTMNMSKCASRAGTSQMIHSIAARSSRSSSLRESLGCPRASHKLRRTKRPRAAR